MYRQTVLLAAIVFSVNCGSILASNGTDHCDDDDAGSKKYLPEFNIDDRIYQKWPHYIDLIRKAHQSPEVDNSNDTCQLFRPLVDQDVGYFVKMFGENYLTKDIVEKMVNVKRGVHYQFVDHRLYRDKECMFPSRCQGIEHFLLQIINQLPNMDLVINVRDYPQVGNYFKIDQQFPILSFSKDVATYADLIYPAWTFWSGGPALDLYPTGIGRWDLMRKSLIKKQAEIPWNQKKKIAFFRGSRTSSARDPIILLSRSRPDLINAKYTKNQAWRSKADTLGDEPASTVSFEDHCQYRYLFNAQGVAASFRLKHLFLCGSLVLNIDSNWIEFFYPLMKPWFHYIPVEANFQNAAELLEFIKESDHVVEQIARRGFEFIKQHLTMSSVKCYWQHLLQSYSDRLVSYRPSRVDKDLIEIR